jgi:hypothetical protein
MYTPCYVSSGGEMGTESVAWKTEQDIKRQIAWLGLSMSLLRTPRYA